jgi:hypothetical protein
VLADDVAAEPDPRPAGELQADAAGFRDGGGETLRQARRLEAHEQRLRAAGEGRQAAEAVRDPGRRRAGVRSWRQVDDEKIDRSTREEGARDREPLVE